jgi:hypothetical protein
MSLVLVGEQDPLAEQLVVEGLAGGGFGAPGEAQLAGLVAGERGGDHPRQPAGPQDLGDLAFDLVAALAGLAAGQTRRDFAQLPARFGEGVADLVA